MNILNTISDYGYRAFSSGSAMILNVADSVKQGTRFTKFATLSLSQFTQNVRDYRVLPLLVTALGVCYVAEIIITKLAKDTIENFYIIKNTLNGNIVKYKKAELDAREEALKRGRDHLERLELKFMEQGRLLPFEEENFL